MASNINCNDNTSDIPKAFCESIKSQLIENEDKQESMQKQIYIISGVGGGVALVLIITLIALAIQISSMRHKAAGLTYKGRAAAKNSKKMSKSGGGGTSSDQKNPQISYPQQQQQQPPQNSYAQQPPKPTASAEDELAQLGFSAYTGHPIDQSQRGFGSTPAINSAGGVRVLPRNPHPNFRQNAGYNDGYM